MALGNMQTTKRIKSAQDVEPLIFSVLPFSYYSFYTARMLKP